MLKIPQSYRGDRKAFFGFSGRLRGASQPRIAMKSDQRPFRFRHSENFSFGASLVAG